MQEIIPQSCAQLFADAQLEALGERERQVIELYYGSDRTLEAIAISEEIADRKLTRARISAILIRACRKIQQRAEQQIQQGMNDGACARLVCTLAQEIRPAQPSAQERLALGAPRLFPQMQGRKARRLVQHLLEGAGNGAMPSWFPKRHHGRE